MPKAPLSATIITLDEERNLERALKSLAWVDEVIIVDSGSQDKTLEIAKRYGAKVFHNDWKGYGVQKNFAQAQAKYSWVLNIDADEEVPIELATEIQTILDQPESLRPEVAYHMPRKTFYMGRWIRHGGWYPNRLVRLAKKESATWTEPMLHEKWNVEGPVGKLLQPICHYPFSSIREQMDTNLRYSWIGHQQLRSQGAGPRLVKLLWKPISKFLETYFIKRGFLDGIPGFIISVNAAHSVFLKYAYFYDRDFT